MLMDTLQGTGCPPFAQKMICPQMSTSQPSQAASIYSRRSRPKQQHCTGAGEAERGWSLHSSVKIGFKRKAWLRARWAGRSPPATEEMKGHTQVDKPHCPSQKHRCHP